MFSDFDLTKMTSSQINDNDHPVRLKQIKIIWVYRDNRIVCLGNQTVDFESESMNQIEYFVLIISLLRKIGYKGNFSYDVTCNSEMFRIIPFLGFY